MAVANPDLKYDFMPWARRGLARAHTHGQLAMDGVSALPNVTIGLKLKGTGGSNMEETPTVDLKLLGPGDVIGIDPRVIVRVEPRANNHDFEPNYLAAIEFDTPDFPWLFTPAKADANDRLAPWLALVVFSRDEVADPVLRPGRVLPSTLLPTNTALPDLSESWMWAHAQVVRDEVSQQVSDMLQNAPSKNLSRLVCPRRLQANKSYIACLVPTFKPGLDAALGKPLDANATLAPAWGGTQAQTGFELACYYHWTFSTGPAGDFETLARRLKAPAEHPSSIQDKLDKLGRLPVEVDADRLLQPHGARQQGTQFVTDNYLAQYEGALLSLAINDSPEPGADDDIADDLASILNAAEESAQGSLALDEPTLQIPVVGPPIYGGFHARRHWIDTAARDRWMDHLNASVPRRMAAGVGTRLVQSNQETFMRAAWQQVGDVLRAERLFSLSHMAKKALSQLMKRFSILPEARRLELFAPAATRIRIDDNFTVYGYAQTTSLPDGFVDGALRRTLSPARALLRRTAGESAAAHLGELAAGFQTKAAAKTFAQPERFRSDGFSGLGVLDGMRLPRRPGRKLNIPGLASGLRVDEVRAILRQGRAADRLLRGEGWSNPSVSEKLKAGVLVDSHYARIAELNAALADRGVTDAFTTAQIAGELAATKPLRAEGVLLSVDTGADKAPTLSARGLKVDARGGQLVDVSPRVSRSGRVGATIFPGTVGLVEVDAIRRYGNSALFNSLPANSVASETSGKTPVVISSTGGSDFVAEDAASDPDKVSITVTPPLSTAVELNRFKDAWREKLALGEVASPPKGVTIDVVPFKTAATTKSATKAIDPNELVTRRVESLLQLGSADFSVDTASPGFIGEYLKDSERFVVPKLYDRVMAYPKINEALYKRLVKMDESAFMPGVEDIPNDTILLVKTNPKFVESFMVGTNHEMGRELLWRGYPTDQRGTPFQRFWQYFDPAKVDIQPIHEWNVYDDLGDAGAPSGDNGEGRLALLIRGQLLRRYPNTAIYAVEKGPGATEPDFSPAAKFVEPEGAGTIGNDIVFFLFPILASEASQHWFVLEEPMTEPRFGFDDQELLREVRRVRRRGGMLVEVGPAAPVGATYLDEVNAQRLLQNLPELPDVVGAGDTWLDVDWGEVGTPIGSHINLGQLQQVDLMDDMLEVEAGSSHAGEVARAMLQRPFRGYFDGNRLS